MIRIKYKTSEIQILLKFIQGDKILTLMGKSSNCCFLIRYFTNQLRWLSLLFFTQWLIQYWLKVINKNNHHLPPKEMRNYSRRISLGHHRKSIKTVWEHQVDLSSIFTQYTHVQYTVSKLYSFADWVYLHFCVCSFCLKYKYSMKVYLQTRKLLQKQHDLDIK